MYSWAELAPLLAGGHNLTYEQSRSLMQTIMSGELDEVRLAAFLSSLAVRGVSVPELLGLADQMQSGAQQITLPSDVVDIVGTGGDGASTANISTMAALVIAAAGYPVVKHGNRASTSSSGSADVLEALGVRLTADDQAVIAGFNDVGIAFLFANKFHPSMRHAARVRRMLGFPTAFNILGPLTNPVRPHASVVGVAKRQAAPLVAGVFAERGTTAFVMRGVDLGLDELTTVEAAHLWVVKDKRITELVLDPTAALGLPKARLEDLVGGSPSTNARIALDVFQGQPGPVADAVALNAALGIMAAWASVDPDHASHDWHEAETLEEGLKSAYALAKETLSSGAAKETLDRWVGRG